MESVKLKNVLLIVLIIMILIWTLLLYKETKNNKGMIETASPKEEQLVKVKMLAKHYMQLENTLLSKKTYKDNIEKIESITTEEFFKNNYTKDGSDVIGIADEIFDYKYNLDTIVAERILEEYKVMIYATETYGEVTYPFTAIITITEDLQISGLSKINHKY